MIQEGATYKWVTHTCEIFPEVHKVTPHHLLELQGATGIGVIDRDVSLLLEGLKDFHLMKAFLEKLRIRKPLEEYEILMRAKRKGRDAYLKISSELSEKRKRRIRQVNLVREACQRLWY